MLDADTYKSLVDKLGSNESNIVILNDYISTEDLSAIYKILLSVHNKHWFDTIWSKIELLKQEDQELIMSVINKITKTVSLYFDQELILKSTTLSKNPKDGYFLPLHSDDREQSPDHYFASVFYINDNYKGGEIYFPQYEKIIKPKANSLIFFPGNLNYMHGVNQCFLNDRYSLAMFYTLDKAKNV
jgi:hypothetical protein